MTFAALSELPADLFLNPIRSALLSSQEKFAIATPSTLRYRPEIAPFAVLTGDVKTGLAELSQAMEPGEVCFLIAETSAPIADAASGVELAAPAPVTQMVFPSKVPLPAQPAIDLLQLSCADAADLVELSAIAYPFFFRPRTCEMGPYFGVRREGRLVSMGGDRMAIERFTEISGVCTLAEHRGHGYAQAIISRIVQEHRAIERVSFLHVSSANSDAIRLYKSLGFVFTREFWITRVRRQSA